MQSGVPIVQGYSTGDSADTLTPHRSEVGEQGLRALLGYDLRQKYGRYVHGAAMSIAALDASVSTVVRYLV